MRLERAPRFQLSELSVLSIGLLALGLSSLQDAAGISLFTSHKHRIRSAGLRNDALWAEPCLKEQWFEQRLDHFHWASGKTGSEDKTFKQRYFICDKYWTKCRDGTCGPIFFYAGNEADVTLYVNATGLIWEHAQEFGALVLFAEHRYYGQTQPLGPDSIAKDPAYLTAEQAMADYAALLWELRAQLGAQASPVVAFGGSYGGMLAAWMRLKYPHLVEGAVAASAPVGAFPGVPGWRPESFWEVVTRDATPAAGCPADCAVNVREAFAGVVLLGRTPEGRAKLAGYLRLCGPLEDEAAAIGAAYWLQGAFDAFAMGNYPYPTSYISDDPAHPLPAWPMRAACARMTGVRREGAADGGGGLGGVSRAHIEALRDAAGVLYNVSGEARCYSTQAQGPAAGNSGPWDYQFCTELLAQELPYYPATGGRDMFWDQGPFDWDAIRAHCAAAWGVAPRPAWAAMTYGGLEVWRHTSNIVFTNGLYDPWSPYGVLSNVSDSVVAVLIPEGAHHTDLMFSRPADPPSLTAARATTLEHVRRWVAPRPAAAAL